MSKVASVATKTFRELVRQRRTMIFSIVLPLAFIAIFGFAFGRTNATTYVVGVVNDDQGTIGANYVAALSNLTYSDGKALLKVVPRTDVAAAKSELSGRALDLVVHVPANFTQGLTPQGGTPPQQPTLPVGQQAPQRPAPPPGSQVDVVVDDGSPNSQAAAQIVNAYTQAFAAKASGQQPLVTESRSTVTSRDLTAFDFLAPGLFVYAVLLMAPQAASLLARESETRTLERIKLSRVRTWELLLGVGLAQLALGLVAFSASMALAFAFGFHPQGSLLIALGVAVLAATSTVGVGMIIASFAKSRDDAANFGVLFAVPASFLSGAFFAVPSVDLFTAGTRTIGLYDILPSTHAVRALRAVLTSGQPIGSQSFDLIVLVVLAIAFFAAGAWLFTQRRMRTVT